MVSVLIAISGDEQEFLLADLLTSGIAGCLEEDGGIRVYFEDRSKIDATLVRYPVREIREEKSEILVQATIPCEPIVAGERFFIVPPGCKKPTPGNRFRLEVETGAAFGSGRHETTQLMLEALEKYVRPESSVADVGCGSGILARAALLLDARRVAACDIDPVFLHRLPPELQGRVFVGSADGIGSGVADVVLANISAKVIDLIAYDLNRTASADGIIVLSGFIRERVPARFSPLHESQCGDWLCWVCKPQHREEDDSARPLVHSLHWY